MTTLFNQELLESEYAESRKLIAEISEYRNSLLLLKEERAS